MEGRILALERKDQPYKDDLHWMVTEADRCYLESWNGMMSLIIVVDLYESVPKEDKTPEA